MTKIGYITNTDSNTISVTGLDTGVEYGQIAIGDSPRGAMAINKDANTGYVANTAGDTISVIDLENQRESQRIHVGLVPRGVDINTPERTGSLPSGFGACSVKIFDAAFPVSKFEESLALAAGEKETV